MPAGEGISAPKYTSILQCFIPLLFNPAARPSPPASPALESSPAFPFVAARAARSSGLISARCRLPICSAISAHELGFRQRTLRGLLQLS